jgi:hypothetical protein
MFGNGSLKGFSLLSILVFILLFTTTGTLTKARKFLWLVNYAVTILITFYTLLFHTFFQLFELLHVSTNIGHHQAILHVSWAIALYLYRCMPVFSRIKVCVKSDKDCQRIILQDNTQGCCTTDWLLWLVCKYPLKVKLETIYWSRSTFLKREL